MAEIIEDVFDQPVIDGDFPRDLWAGKPIRNFDLSRPLLRDAF
jgi:hypothetical protein